MPEGGSYRGRGLIGNDPEFEVQLGNVCNNRCNFCSSGQATELRRAGIVGMDEALGTLDRAKEQGFKKVTFLGGEPTIFKTFIPSLRRAVELGFDEIVIFTNGVKSRNPEWVEEVVSIGEFTWRFSIQGGNREAHDLVTGRDGAFDRIIQGMTHLGRLGQRLTSNMCVNEDSYRSLPDLPDVAAAHGLQQCCIDMVRANSTGHRTDEYLRDIIPRFSDMAPYIDKMLERFEEVAPHCDVNLTNFPYCLLPHRAHVMSHGGEMTTTFTVDDKNSVGEVHQRAFNKYEFQVSDRVHPNCTGCAFRPICKGVSTKYIEFYGTDEIAPVTREQLLALPDAKTRLFSLLVRPYLAPLRSHEPPDEWVVGTPQGNNRDGRLDIRCRHPLGDVFLAFTPAGKRGADLDHYTPVLRTNWFDLRVMLTPGAEAAPIARLAAWAQDILGLDPEITVTQRLPWPPPAPRRQPTRVDRGRAHVARLVRSLRGGHYDGWRCVGARSERDGAVARVLFRGPADAALQLTLAVNEDESQPLVGVSFDLAAGTVPDTARPGVDAITRALRASFGGGASESEPRASV